MGTDRICDTLKFHFYGQLGMPLTSPTSPIESMESLDHGERIREREMGYYHQPVPVNGKR